jgi:spore germination protein
MYDYSQRIVGKFLAYILAIIFILYFLMISSYLNIQLTDVLSAEFFPQTPHWALLVSSVIIFGWIAQRGVVSVARFFEIIGTVFVITAVAIHLVMLTQGDMRQIQPFFRASKLPEYMLGVKETISSFLGIELLLIFPLSGNNIKRTTWVAFLTIIFVGLFYVLVVESSISILGMQSAKNYNYALIEAIKQIDIPVLERFDIVFLTVGFAGMVAGISGVYLAMVEFSVRIFKTVNRSLIVLCIGVLIIAVSIASQAVKAAIDVYQMVIPFAGLITVFLIPVSLLLIAKVRGLVQKT